MKYHTLNGLNNKNLHSLNPGRGAGVGGSQIRSLAELVSSEASRLDLLMSVFFLCLFIFPLYLSVSKFLLVRTPVVLD